MHLTFLRLIALGCYFFTHSALAGTFPITGNNTTDPYLIMRASANSCGEGDSVTCTDSANGLTSNKYYSFFIELPTGTGELRIELFDADVRLGGVAESTDGRDNNVGSYNYTLLDPTGSVQITRFNRGISTGTGLLDVATSSSVDCQPGSPGSLGDNAWCLLIARSNPAPATGHWELRMAPNGTTAQNSAIGLRARDTITGRDLNVYARSYIHYGNQNANDRRRYTVANGNNVFYPYVSAGCSLRAYDFDSDNDVNQVHTFDYLGGGVPQSVTHTNASNVFSGNDAWNTELITHASDTAAQRYGMWRFQGISGNIANHIEIWASPETINLIPPTTQPTPGSFRYYFPQNNGSAPTKPIFRHSVTNIVSGAATPAVGLPTRLRIGLAIRNPTPYAINFNASNLVTLEIPASDANVTRRYKGNFTTTCGAPTPVSQPVIDGAGTLTWNPGAVPAGGGCNATYEIEVQPISAGRHLLTGPTASGTTAAMLDETGTAFTFGPLCELAVATGTDYSSVPVSIGYVNAKSGQDDSISMEFETSSETGSLYFNIIDAKNTEVELAEPVAATASGDHEPATYRLSMRKPPSGQFYIDQIENGGKLQRFGPYNLNVEHGARVVRQQTDWNKIQSEQRRFASTQADRTLPQRAKLTLEKTAFYKITHTELFAAGVDLRGIPSNEIALVADGKGLQRNVGPGSIFGADSFVEFHAEVEPQRYYGKRRFVWVEQNLALAKPISRSQRVPAANGALESQNKQALLRVDREYAAGSPLDPWYMRRLARGNSGFTSVSETLQLDAPQINAPAQLSLTASGGLDFAGESPDHAFNVSLNGQSLGDYRFDGINPIQTSWDIPLGVLRPNANTVTFTLLATGYATDRINIESIQINYRSASSAAQGIWELQNLAEEGDVLANSDYLFAAGFDMEASVNCSGDCTRYKIAGLSNSPRIFRTWDGNVEESFGHRAQGANWLVVADLPGKYYAYAAAITPAVSTVVEPATMATEVDFLVVSHPSFTSALQPLIEKRRAEGLRTQLLTTDAIYSAQRASAPSAQTIADFVRRRLVSAPRYLLLVGGDSYDYDNVLGLGSQSFVPTFYVRTSEFVNHAPSDFSFADLNGDGRPDLAVGRWPVRTLAETQAMVNKTLAFATAPRNGGALLLSDRSSTPYRFAEQNSIMASGVAYGGIRVELALDTFPTGITGTDAARLALQSSVNAGARWLNYFGHASPYQWSGSGLLRNNDVASGLFTNTQSPFLATQWGCWGAYYVLPNYDSLAHRLLLGDSGAAALIGAASLAETGPSTALAAALLPQLDNSERLGDSLRNALTEIVGNNPAALDVIYGTSLLGDPSMPLR